MSVKVDITDLSSALSGYGFAYLLTVSEEQRAHAVALHPVVEGDSLVVRGLGRRTRANLEARPDVTVLWSPTEEDGYSLIVDGRATATADGATITPTTAVLHRPAADDAEPSATGCGSDCAPLTPDH